MPDQSRLLADRRVQGAPTSLEAASDRRGGMAILSAEVGAELLAEAVEGGRWPINLCGWSVRSWALGGTPQGRLIPDSRGGSVTYQ